MTDSPQVKTALFTLLKVAAMLGATGYFLFNIFSTYAFVIYKEEGTTDDFADGYFYSTALNSSGTEYVQLSPVGLTGNWITQTKELPQGLYEVAAVLAPDPNNYYKARIIAVGGSDAELNCHAEVYTTTVDISRNPNDNISAWVTQTNSLPEGRCGHAAAIYRHSDLTSTIFILGGYDDSGAFKDEIYQATVNNVTGSVGEWTDLSVNLPEKLQYHSVVENDGRLYLIGGEYEKTVGALGSPKVYSASIQPDGTLSDWTDLGQDLNVVPNGGHFAGAAMVHHGSISDTIYVVGGVGEPSSGDYTTTYKVWFTDILNDGGILSWTEAVSSVLPTPNNQHGGVIVNEAVMYIIGGRTGVFEDTSALTNVVKAVNTDEEDPDRIYNWCAGSVDPACNRWQEGALLPRKLSNPAVVQYKGHIYVIGGVQRVTQDEALIYTYHGDTTGPGLNVKYVPKGYYVSGAIDFGQTGTLKALVWQADNIIVPTTSITLSYYFTDTQGGLLNPNWIEASPFISSNVGGNTYRFTCTQLITESYQWFKYKAFFKTISPTLSPKLDWVRIYYDVPDPDVSVSKKAEKSVYRPGETITYTIYYTAEGGVPAQGVAITEQLPVSTTYKGGPEWTQVGTSDYYTHYVGTFGMTGTQNISAATIQFPVQITINAPTDLKTITDVVRIYYPPMSDWWGNLIYEPITVNNSDTITVSLKHIIWKISKNSTPPPRSQVKPTDPITYTLVFTNIGSSSEDEDTIVVDHYNANFLRNVTATGASAVVKGGLITFTLPGPINPNDPKRLTITAQITRPLDTGTQILNWAEISSEYALPTRTLDITHTVISSPTLHITKTANPPPRTPAPLGSPILYTITYSNTGSMNAYHVAITDTVSQYLYNINPGPPGVFAGGIITWVNLPMLTVDSQAFVTFTAQVTSSLSAVGKTITDVAQIRADYALTQTSAPITHVITYGPVLGITKTDGINLPNEVSQGQTLTYTIRYTNTGTLTATNLILTDTIPFSTTYQGGGWNPAGGRVYTMTAPPLAAGQGSAVIISIKVNDNATPDMWLTNTVKISGADPYGNPLTPKIATDVDRVKAPRPVLSLSKTDGLTSVEPGDCITYTIYYTNSSPTNTAYNLILTETLPVSLTYVGYGWTKVGAYIYTKSLPKLAPGESAYAEIKACVKYGAPPGTITNTVQIGALYTNTITATDTTYITQVAKLLIKKSDGRGGLTVNDVITYTIVYTNAGNVGFTGVILTDTLPPSVTHVAHSSGLTVVSSNSIYSKNIGTLDPGASGLEWIAIQVNPPYSRTITNTVWITATSPYTGQYSGDADYVFQKPPPTGGLYDLYVFRIATNPQIPIVGMATNLIVTVKNEGTGEAMPAEGELIIGEIRIPIAEAISATEALTYCYTALYIDPLPPPQYPYDYNYNYISYVPLPLDVGETYTITGWCESNNYENCSYNDNHTFETAGEHTIYAQADVHADIPGALCNPYYGCVPEMDETDNITSTVIYVAPSGTKVYLPIIFKNYQ